jgi:hypothetical protein
VKVIQYHLFYDILATSAKNWDISLTSQRCQRKEMTLSQKMFNKGTAVTVVRGQGGHA